jgi:hypothetical protein
MGRKRAHVELVVSGCRSARAEDAGRGALDGYDDGGVRGVCELCVVSSLKPQAHDRIHFVLESLG